VKKLIAYMIILSLFSSLLTAQTNIKAMKVLGSVSTVGPFSKAWLSSNYQVVTLYSHPTLKIDPRDASAFIARAKKIKIKVIYDGENISFLLKWRDETKSAQEWYSLSHDDGYEINFPLNFKDIDKLPYIGAASKKRAVMVYHQSYRGEQSTFLEEQFVTKGIGERIYVENNTTVIMNMSYKKKHWIGVLSIPLKTAHLDLDKGAFPIAFSLWDGDESNVDRAKLLSSWIGVKLVTKSGGEKLIERLGSRLKGDALRGEKIASENCAVCHRYAQDNTAPKEMAPNLSNIGGYSTKEYLKESIINPSAIVISNPNKNSNFPWHNINKKGKKTSTMPSYDWLDEKNIDDIVAFLKKMKTNVK